jgi:hypothetical protein
VRIVFFWVRCIEIFAKDHEVIILGDVVGKTIMFALKANELRGRSVVGNLGRDGLLIVQHLLE